MKYGRKLKQKRDNRDGRNLKKERDNRGEIK
jgi:hypothetical protein